MTTKTPFAHAARSRRARAVYSSHRRCGPVAGLIARQLGLLAAMTLAVACVIGLRAWLAV